MRLLLDEQFSPTIAEQLRRKGYDVVAVAEIPELTSLGDRELLSHAAAEGRGLVTNNVVDFAPLFGQFAQSDLAHPGLIFTSDRRFPRTRAGTGALVRALGSLLDACPADDALTNQQRWLS